MFSAAVLESLAVHPRRGASQYRTQRGGRLCSAAGRPPGNACGRTQGRDRSFCDLSHGGGFEPPLLLPLPPSLYLPWPSQPYAGYSALERRNSPQEVHDGVATDVVAFKPSLPHSCLCRLLYACRGPRNSTQAILLCSIRIHHKETPLRHLLAMLHSLPNFLYES